MNFVKTIDLMFLSCFTLLKKISDSEFEALGKLVIEGYVRVLAKSNCNTLDFVTVQHLYAAVD